MNKKQVIKAGLIATILFIYVYAYPYLIMVYLGFWHTALVGMFVLLICLGIALIPWENKDKKCSGQAEKGI
jgi:hypothetical protein